MADRRVWPLEPASWALVTGASDGIGAAFALSLAAGGHPVVLVARREGRLRELASHLAAVHRVEAVVVAADLATPEGLARCRDAVAALPGPLGAAVLNAGVGSRGPVHASDRAHEADMTRLNCVAVADLAAAVLPGMVERAAGALIVVSSAAAAQPVPYMATYAATKAFELSLVRGVAEELRGTGVRALAVCPGPVQTGFHRAGWGEDLPGWMPAEAPSHVVERARRGLARGRVAVPSGPIARLTMPLVRLAPMPLVVRVAGALHRPGPGSRHLEVGGPGLEGPGAARRIPAETAGRSPAGDAPHAESSAPAGAAGGEM